VALELMPIPVPLALLVALAFWIVIPVVLTPTLAVPAGEYWFVPKLPWKFPSGLT
jgi:hypothetical protein